MTAAATVNRARRDFGRKFRLAAPPEGESIRDDVSISAPCGDEVLSEFLAQSADQNFQRIGVRFALAAIDLLRQLDSRDRPASVVYEVANSAVL